MTLLTKKDVLILTANIDQLPTNLTEAKRLSSKHYYTGKPCKQGHVSIRATCDRECMMCINEKDRKRYSANKNIRNEKRRNRYKIKPTGKFHRSIRRAALKKACPLWVNKKELRNIYFNCPEGHEVDHIVPLSNPWVCGLHVPWNLQYLLKEVNRSKANTFKQEF